MKTEEFMALAKSGQKEFVELDIEGSFVNEDLSNLSFEKCFIVADFTGANLSKSVFERCNLKTCIFNYCNLESTSFESNCLDAADFKFVQYNSLIFKNNSAYGCDFTKEILEDIQYTNYPGFHIVQIKAGWFEVILIDRVKSVIVTASDYLGNDAPYELLKSLNEICEDKAMNTSITRWLCWDEEPGAYIWKLIRENNKIKIAVYAAKRDSYDIDLEDRKDLEKEEVIETEIEIEGEFLGFIKEVAGAFEKIRDLKGEKLYEEQWGKFPVHELKRLKSFISEIKHKK